MENLFCKFQSPVHPIVVPKNEDFVKNFLKNIVVVESDPLKDLLIDPVFKTQVHSDVWLLTNLNRIDSMSPSALAEIIRTRFKENNNSDLYSGLSDDELFSVIKSRRIQSLHELNDFVDYLSDSQVDILERAKAASESAKVVNIDSSHVDDIDVSSN